MIFLKKNCTNIEELKQLFEKASPAKQWEFVINFGSQYDLQLKINKRVTILLLRENDKKLKLKMKEHIGRNPGIKHLLNYLNIKHNINE